jgi:uncharacterized protein YjiS (DUF1127 family)
MLRHERPIEEGKMDNRGVFGKSLVRGWSALFGWRERMWRRRDLAALSGRDLADLGIPPALAVYEAGRWPWQKISPEWREFEEAGQDGG